MRDNEVRDRVYARVVALREIAPDAAEEVALAMLTGTAEAFREISSGAPGDATRRIIDALGLDVPQLLAALIH